MATATAAHVHHPDVYIRAATLDGDDNTNVNNNKPIAVNDLLSFVIHKLRFMPPDSVVMMCSQFYSDEEILTAKKLLNDTCGNDEDGRIVIRRGPKKTLENMQDIIKVVQLKACVPRNNKM